MAGKRSRRVLVAIVATLALPFGGAAAPAIADEVTVTQGTNLAVAPAPDGSMVMDLQGTLWRVPAAGGAATRLTGDEAEPSLPVVTPDGRRVIYQDYSDGNFHIWSMAADGSDRQRLTDGPVDDREPAVSPGGRSVAFSSDRSGTYGIWVLDIATGEVRPWADTPDQDSQPTWSPDGREIAWV